MKILHINANPKPVEESNSKQLTEVFFKTLKQEAPHFEITHVDLYESPPPFYSYNNYRFFWYPLYNSDYKPSPEEEAAAEYAKHQCSLFNDADVLVLTVPLWNFSVPSILKAWEDQVLSPNYTFTSGAGGTKPLHHIKKVVLLLSSGGAYQGDRASSDFLTGQLKTALGFVGIKDFSIAWADGQNTFFFKDSDERKKKGLEDAKEAAKLIAKM